MSLEKRDLGVQKEACLEYYPITLKILVQYIGDIRTGRDSRMKEEWRRKKELEIRTQGRLDRSAGKFSLLPQPPVFENCFGCDTGCCLYFGALYPLNCVFQVDRMIIKSVQLMTFAKNNEKYSWNAVKIFLYSIFWKHSLVLKASTKPLSPLILFDKSFNIEIDVMVLINSYMYIRSNDQILIKHFLRTDVPN